MSVVCSTTHLFHYLFSENADTLQSMLEYGLCPLSDFPESERWKQIQAYRSDFFEAIYENFAKPVIQKPYQNSGIFLTSIDFYKLPNTFLFNKTRIAVPIEHINPAYSAITYVYQNERVSLPFGRDTLEDVAKLWQEDLVREWFGKDQSKVFFYVPQVITYERIPVTEADIEKLTVG